MIKRISIFTVSIFLVLIAFGILMSVVSERIYVFADSNMNFAVNVIPRQYLESTETNAVYAYYNI